MAALVRFAPLELLTAWTPAHSDPATLTCRFDVATLCLDEACAPAVVPEGSDVRWIGDDAARREVQTALESGRRFEVVGPPGAGGVPIREGASP